MMKSSSMLEVPGSTKIYHVAPQAGKFHVRLCLTCFGQYTSDVTRAGGRDGV
jgi:hypothetical protein